MAASRRPRATKRTAGAPVAAPSYEEGAATKAARTRRRILDAAAKILSIKGYSGMRLTDVANEAELQAPAIYYHFDSREDLIEEVMWVGIADMREHLIAALAAAPQDATPMDRILLAVESHLRHELQISDYTTASIRNAGQIPDRIRKRQLQEEAKYGQVWRELFIAADDAGQLREDLDLYTAQMLVMGSLNWAAEWWKPRRGTLAKLVENAQSFVRSALIA